jgi:hypothetical protein
MQIQEYDFYEASLTITIHTSRPDAAPSTVFTAGQLHNEWVAKVRAALREKKDAIEGYLPTAGGFPLYGIRRVMPVGTVRSVDQDFMLEVTQIRFALGIAFLPSTWTAGEVKALGVERNIEKATKDLFEAQGLPTTVIPGDGDQLGESFVEIMCELGGATNQGEIHDVN